jgi:uncharacterized protein (TIGR02001 family)
MNKKIILSSFASLLFLSQAANSEIKAGPITLTPGIMFQSNYVGEFTGLTTNRTQPTYGADINISHNSGVYIYSAVKKLKNYPMQADIDAYGTFDWEFCNSLGYATKIQNLGLDASYENCYQDKKTEENIGTFYLRANYDLTKQTSIGAAYANDTTDGSFVGANKFGSDAYKFFVSHDLNLAKAILTYGESDNLTKFYTVALNKDLFGINFDLAYWDVDAAGWTGGTSDIERQLLVLSLKKTF